MKERLLSAGVGIILCLAVFFLGEWNSIVIVIAVSLITGLMCGELLTAKGLHKNFVVSLPCIIFGALIPALSITDFRFLPIYLFMLALFICMVVFHEKVNSNDVMFAYGGTLLISLSMASLAYVSSVGGFPTFYLVLALGVPWLSDSGAYFAGVFLGKHKLCPKISPKKTIEGAVGGLLSGCLGALLIAWVFGFIYPEAIINLVPVLIVGAVNPIVSIFGDLTFSVIKRTCGIKDYGSIMPGHGGALDRFDSIVFCAPLVFIVSQYFVFIS